MRVSKKLILFICLLSWSKVNTATTRIDLTSNFWLDYEFPDDSNIKITMNSKSQGYVAIGFGSRMANSDMIMGQMVGGQAKVLDMYCNGGHDTPVEDTQNDIKNPSGSRTSSTTSFTFTRSLITGDSKDSNIVPNQARSIIWVFGK